jgi:hypothetical protein
LELHVKAEVPLHQCGIEDVKTLQRFLVGYQIHVISREHFNGITFVTVCTEVDATQERSHAGNHIVMVVVVVQVDLLLGCGSMVNDSVDLLLQM